MKQVNKDYIAIVRNNSGKLQYERVPIQKSEILRGRLVGMANDERFTIKDMRNLLITSPLFEYMASPFFDEAKSVEFCRPVNWTMKRSVDELAKQKTKMNFLESALAIIDECDYRWNVLKLFGNSKDVFVRSLADYECASVDIHLNGDSALLVEADSVGEEFDGLLFFTVVKEDLEVLPYRALVELYDCSEDILDNTRTFDAEQLQWDNFLRAVASTANEINARGEEYFKEKVIEDGLFMAEKITQMCTDLKNYNDWLRYERDPVQIEYSENEDTPDAVEKYDVDLREMYELYVVGKKLTCAMYLAENLLEWATRGGEYAQLARVYPQMINLGPTVLERLESLYETIPADAIDDEQMFSDGFQRYHLARNIKRIITDLKEWIGLTTPHSEK